MDHRTLRSAFVTWDSASYLLLMRTRWQIGRLPVHHRDPFGRMLVAQAAVEGLTLVTRDIDIRKYDIDLLLV